MDPQKHETIEKRLIRWLIIATLALLILVLGLRAWQLVRSGSAPQEEGAPLTQDAGQTAEPSDPPAASTDVSPGKTAMVEDVRALNSALSFDDLAALTAEELEQLCAAGAPGLPIGRSAAAQRAEEYAGTLEADSVTSKTDPELDESPAHYEVELHHPTLGEFEYKIDAYTGAVLEGAPNILQSTYVPASGDGESRPAAASPSAPPAPSSTPASGGEAANGEESAKAAAFAHAGVAPENVTGLKVKSDWEDGVRVYEIEFWADGVEYDYEIEAASGTVLKAGQEWGGAASGGAQGSASLIGEDAAKAAALTHAGVDAQDVAYIRWELDQDDGVRLYEIEFTVGGVEYEYEIDAVTGAVRKAEQDR